MVKLRSDIAAGGKFLAVSGGTFGIMGNLLGSLSSMMIGIGMLWLAASPVALLHFLQWRGVE